jgi:S-adenosylmethionine:tRNA ribosyltransferase-isomerase
LLNEFSETGIQVRWITLHVGVGTFAPVKAERLENHRMHRERYSIPAQTAESIAAAKAEGRRVIAVGTTTLRVLESVARNEGRIAPGAGCTDIFIYPPFQFKIVDALLTNFHLPRSTLLMLVSAFASPGSTDGIQRVLKAYHEAIRANYRFFSYGDAMLLL